MRISILLLVVSACTCASSLSFSQDLENSLKAKLANQIVQLKVPYSDPIVKFSSDGTTDATRQGPWTLDGKLQINQVHLKKEKLEISGNRILIAFSQKPQQQPTYFKGPSFTVELERSPSDLDGRQLSKAINLTFLTHGEKLSNYVPEVWQSAVGRLLEGVPETLHATANPIAGVKGVSAPSVIKQVDPEFAPESKAAKYQGVCVLSAVIDPVA